MEKADKYKTRTGPNHGDAVDHFGSPTFFETVDNDQHSPNNSRFHTTVSETLQLSETSPAWSSLLLQPANGLVKKPPKSANRNCEIDKEKNERDDNYGNNVFASLKTKRGFRYRVADTNKQNGFSFHGTVSETVPTSETFRTCSSPLIRPTNGDVCNQPKSSAFKNYCEVDKKQKYPSDTDDDENDEGDDDNHIFTTWKKKNRTLQCRILNRNHHQQTGVSIRTTASESVPTCPSPLDEAANSDANSPSTSTDKDCELDKVEKLLSFDDHTDEDDDIFASSKTKNDFYRCIANGGWRIGPESKWRSFGKPQNRKYQQQVSANMAAERDDHVPTFIAASGLDDDSDMNNVPTSTGNGKRKGILQHYNAKTMRRASV